MINFYLNSQTHISSNSQRESAFDYLDICDLVYKKGPYVSNYSQWQTRHVLIHVLGNIDCKWHYTPHQDSFFVFRWYTRTTEIFINVISNTTASAIPLITILVNSLCQASHLGIKNQQLTHVTTIILCVEIKLQVLEARLAPPNGEMRTNLVRTWWNAYVSCIVISSYLKKYGHILYRTNISTFWSSWNKKIRKNLKLTEPFVYLYQLLSRKFFFRT